MASYKENTPNTSPCQHLSAVSGRTKALICQRALRSGEFPDPESLAIGNNIGIGYLESVVNIGHGSKWLESGVCLSWLDRIHEAQKGKT